LQEKLPFKFRISLLHLNSRIKNDFRIRIDSETPKYKSKMPARPYIQKSIKELEELFCKQGADASVLAKLMAELGFRKTKRAIALRDKISSPTTTTIRLRPEKKVELIQTQLELPENRALEETSETPESKNNRIKPEGSRPETSDYQRRARYSLCMVCA